MSPLTFGWLSSCRSRTSILVHQACATQKKSFALIASGFANQLAFAPLLALALGVPIAFVVVELSLGKDHSFFGGHD